MCFSMFIIVKEKYENCLLPFLYAEIFTAVSMKQLYTFRANASIKYGPYLAAKVRLPHGGSK